MRHSDPEKALPHSQNNNPDPPDPSPPSPDGTSPDCSVPPDMLYPSHRPRGTTSVPATSGPASSTPPAPAHCAPPQIFSFFESPLRTVFQLLLHRPVPGEDSPARTLPLHHPGVKSSSDRKFGQPPSPASHPEPAPG